MINLKLSLDDINLVLSALSELPAKISLNIINDIRTQAIPQIEEESLNLEGED